MKKIIATTIGLVGLGLAAPASAAPFSAAGTAAETTTVIETVQGYHKNCVWVNNGWGYHSGGKVLVCRPHKPKGYGWTWHKEGNKHGWYQHRAKKWHHQKW